MISHAGLKIKVLLMVFLIAKIAGPLFLLVGAIDITAALLGRQVAIAQDETGEDSKEQTEDKKSEEEKDKDKEEKGEESGEEKVDSKKEAAKELRMTLDGLEEKRIRIQQAQQRLEEKQAQMEALKQEIEEKVSELSKVHKQLEDTLAKMERKLSADELKEIAKKEAKLKQLVKVYSSMKPKTAAALIDQLDMDVTLKLFSRMKGDKIGKILSYVERGRAATISEKLAVNGKKVKKK